MVTQCALQSFISDKHCLSSKIINEMIILMSRTVLLQLLVEIRKACWFSLIAHETTDVSHKEQLCTAIRWVDNLFQIMRLMCTKYIHLHHSTYLSFCVSYMGSINCINFHIVRCSSCKSFIDELCLGTKL